VIPAELTPILSSNPEITGRAVCFVGTRSSFQIILDKHRAGVSIDEVLDAYPELSPEQVQSVFNWADLNPRDA
jgi:uncharacterized protein (DUF433 family)